MPARIERHVQAGIVYKFRELKKCISFLTMSLTAFPTLIDENINNQKISS